MKNSFLIKGGIAFSEGRDAIKTFEDGYILCLDGKVEAIFDSEAPVQELYPKLQVIDHSGKLIVPGMTDLHVHAPQYTFRGLGMDLELLDWLNIHTFPEEAKYQDGEYARKAYKYFTEDLRRSFTTRAVIFATIHKDSTKILMDQLEESGIITYVGKVNMDRNGGEKLLEENARAALEAVEKWLLETEGCYERTWPIITPRFIPSCSDELMKGLGAICREKNLRLQSHLSENPSEVAWVKELVPSAYNYANAYEIMGCMGEEDRPAIMAHCVYSDDSELEILKKHGAYVAHCPDSNFNLTSGIAPVRKMLDKGVKVGIGTDVAAGSSLNILKTMLSCLQASKMYYRYVDSDSAALTFEEVFYLATLGGGEYFGNVGTFKKGYEFDAVVIDDSKMQSMRNANVRERIERVVYNDSDCVIRDKFVRGVRVFENQW